MDKKYILSQPQITPTETLAYYSSHSQNNDKSNSKSKNHNMCCSNCTDEEERCYSCICTTSIMIIAIVLITKYAC